MMMMKKQKVIGSSSSSSSSSTVVPNGEANLSEKLILNIFTRLPPISVLRCKCLSKTFYSLISNPDFLQSHQFRCQDPSLPPPIPRIIFKQRYELSGDSKVVMVSPLSPDDSKVVMVSPPSPGDRGYYFQLLQNLIDDQPNGSNVKFSVIDSCNGLLLYLNCVGYHRLPFEKCIWYVCNPIIKDYIKLPPLEEEQGLKILTYSPANLVFDPSLSLTYKVLIWVVCREGGYQADYRLYVYSSETRSWRFSVKITTINDIPFRIIQKLFCRFDVRAVLLNGVLYWTTASPVMIDDLLCYDTEKDSLWTLKYPKMPVECVRRQLHYFGVCGGGLRLIENYYKQWYGGGEFASSFDVMEMNQLQLQQQYQDHQDGNIGRDLWTVKYHVNIEEGSYYGNLIRKKSLMRFILDPYKSATMSGVFILDLYKARGEVEEVLLCINGSDDRLVISLNLSDNTFGKELRHNELLCRDHFSGFTSVVLYDNITLFPLLHYQECV